MTNIRGNKNVRLVVLLLIIALAAGLWYVGDKNDSKGAKIAAGIAGGAALIATGLEINDTDFDLKKLYETGSLKESLLARDEDGNLITNPNVFCKAQEEDFYNFNCKDFVTQPEAQKIYETCKGDRQGDVFGLDGNNNGIVCEALPKKKKIDKK